MSETQAAARKGFDFSYAFTLACIFVTGLASAGLLAIKPLVVGALIDDYHFTPAHAGFIAGIEMAGIGVASFIVAAFGGTWNRRMVIIVGATLGILGSIVPALTEAFTPIFITRLIAGLGSGFIAANILSVIGTTRDPDRTFGLYYMTTYAGMSLIVPGGVWTIGHFGVPGAYFLLALILVPVYAMVFRIPGTVSGLRGGPTNEVLIPFPWMGAVLSLGLSLLYWVGVGAVWAFVERMGVEAGLSKVVIGGVLSSGPLASIAGAATASVLHTRFGRGPLLAISIALGMVSIIMIGWGGTATLYTVGFLIFSYVWPLFLAYLGGAMAVVDPAGRVVGMSVASQTVGMAIGPAIGGVVAGYFGYDAITVLGLICFALCFPVLALLLIKTRAAKEPE